MKILIVSGYFPPKAPAAATRMNKLAPFLLARGHDVRVLTQGGLPFPEVLSPEIPTEKIIYTKTLDVRSIPDIVMAAPGRLLWQKRSENSKAASSGPDHAGDQSNKPASGLKPRIKKSLRPLGKLYVDLFCWPDPHIGWLPWGMREGSRLMASWKPDIVYSSAPPHSSSILARRLGRRFAVPWVCELRDLWVDHPYYDEPAWRRWLEGIHERRVFRDAAGLVTVTAPWARLLERKYGKPTLLSMNGFDPKDFPETPPERQADEPALVIRYLGILYRDKRDPTPLFEALTLLGDAARKIRVQFFGPDLRFVDELRHRYGLGSVVETHESVPYDRSIDLQRRADILLLLRWDNPGENSVIAGKFFEYLGSRRPILSVGSTEGVVADVIRERGAGLVSRSPEEIAGQLREWLLVKAEQGALPPLPLSVRRGFSRTDQFEKLEDFLRTIVQ